MCDNDATAGCVAVAAADADNGLTALQEYVNRPDAHYKWTYMPENNLVGDGFTAYMVRKQRRNSGTGHPPPTARLAVG